MDPRSTVTVDVDDTPIVIVFVVVVTLCGVNGESCGSTEMIGESDKFSLDDIIIIGAIGSICWMLMMLTGLSSTGSLDSS